MENGEERKEIFRWILFIKGRVRNRVFCDDGYLVGVFIG